MSLRAVWLRSVNLKSTADGTSCCCVKTKGKGLQFIPHCDKGPFKATAVVYTEFWGPRSGMKRCGHRNKTEDHEEESDKDMQCVSPTV